MKRLLLCFLFWVLPAHATTLNLYAWGGNFPQSVLQKFEDETGVHVNLAEYDSNEILYAKLKSTPHAGYDVIVPSSYYLEKMRHEDMLYPIDETAVPNKRNIRAFFLNKPYDPNNRYDIPFIFTATGIVVNSKYYDPKTIQRFSQFWEPRFKNQLLILNDVRDTFSIALLKLKLSPNTQNAAQIQQAYFALKALLPNIRLFNSSSPAIIYSDDDIHIGIGWSGDIYKASVNNPSIHFTFPKDGFVYSLDCLAIPRYAPHPKLAMQFINFTQRPDINRDIMAGYKSPSTNSKGMALLPKIMRDNKTFNPSDKTLARATLLTDVGKALSTYMTYWGALKLGR